MRSQTPTVCGIQAPLTPRGFLTWVTQVPALQGRPTVKRHNAASNSNHPHKLWLAVNNQANPKQLNPSSLAVFNPFRIGTGSLGNHGPRSGINVPSLHP